MFDLLLANLRARGLPVGLGEWLAFLDGLGRGLAVDLDGLYRFGRAVLCRTEADYDAWDVAFRATFEGVELEPDISEQLASWLADALGLPPDGPPRDFDLERLREEFLRRLAEQRERHDGGSRWIGTGGTSPFGRAGRASGGVQVGGGGGRSALLVAGERRWKDYSGDRTIDVRGYEVALRALRHLVREGEPELDLDETVRRTGENAGDIELVFRRGRANRVHLVLVMDTGGSMAPHAERVERLFSAARAARGFRSFEAWQFHNAPYGWLARSWSRGDRVPLDELLRRWTPEHRVLLVGDASMAPYELFEPFGGGPWSRRPGPGLSGLDWLKRIRARCPHSAWLNPDPPRWWRHPTVEAVAAVFPMYPLTVQGLRDAVRSLRGGRPARPGLHVA